MASPHTNADAMTALPADPQVADFMPSGRYLSKITIREACIECAVTS